MNAPTSFGTQNAGHELQLTSGKSISRTLGPGTRSRLPARAFTALAGSQV